MATLSYLSCPHFPGNRQRRFPGKWGRVEGGGLVAATCIPDRDKENVQLFEPVFSGVKKMTFVKFVTSHKMCVLQVPNKHEGRYECN